MTVGTRNSPGKPIPKRDFEARLPVSRLRIKPPLQVVNRVIITSGM